MYQRDYLLRMIEQFSVVLGKVIFQRRNQRFAEALELLAQSMKQLLGLNSKLVRGLSAKDLIGLLSAQGQFDAGKGLLLSDMLKAEAEVLLDQGEAAEGRSCSLKSVELLLELRRLPEAEELEREIAERLEEQLPQVQRYRMPRRVTELVMEYFAEQGQLAKAEDMLYFLLEETPDDPVLLEEALGRLREWMDLSEEQLKAGGLTREEVNESYEQLFKMKSKEKQME